ncbi:MAG: hypothetical protein LC799_06325 [Actinobacteria bacterium]|nr:hypothetical protein [Actinomycetota bacterium]
MPSPRHSMLIRFGRIMKWLALLSVVVAAIAVLLVSRGDEGVPGRLLVATALGVGLTVLLGTALMSLTFLSSSSGHDERATPSIDKAGDEDST